MKLPFSFGSRLIFRLVLPGFLLAVVFLPLYLWCTSEIGVTSKPFLYLPAAALSLGWVIMLCDMHVYMIFEGRRYWPAWIREWSIRREAQRLSSLFEETEKLKKNEDHSGSVEKAIETSNFPLNVEGAREARYPTRLGNLIAEYEEYPTTKYGMDGTFYWYRLWIGLPKDVRDEIDEQQSFVDSSLYIAFILFFSVIPLSGYVLYAWFKGVDLSPATPLWLEVLGCLLLVILGYWVYRISLQAHIRYGEFFKSIFDRHYEDFDTKNILKIISEETGTSSIRFLSANEARRACWRYLRWHKVRLPDQTESENIGQIHSE